MRLRNNTEDKMGKFFSRYKVQEPDPTKASWGNIAGFYSLLSFLIAIPFVLIVALVWLTGILGFNAYIFAGFAVLCGLAIWRLYRKWGQFKARMAAQSGEMQDIMREAARNGKNVEVSLLNGLVTLRYGGQGGWPAGLPQGQREPLALEGPDSVVLEAEAITAPTLNPERLREELAEFHRLLDAGVINSEEFDRIKAGLLQKIA
jgi:hypothetical protein